MVGRVRLHKLQQQKETKLIIEEVVNLLNITFHSFLKIGLRYQVDHLGRMYITP